ncbi:hypothetical protein Acal01_02670 [Acinetobacter calcoaceticus]|jgi:hypothetical protein|uniref:hypothetical protein n=1 Tax=Acinetobacter calcoaceticus TaxID=471 RepID=UPI000300755F|nr:hypothetical protein [Acinetobacter calcoaceticus]
MKNLTHIFLFCIGFLVATTSYAQVNIKPLWHGKVLKDFDITLNSLKKPKQVIKGEVDECNGGYFPDQWIYEDGVILSTGSLDKVYVSQKNGLKYGSRLFNHLTTENEFKKFFGKQIDISENHTYSIFPWEGSNDGLHFHFRNGKLHYYTHSIDDC